MLPNEVLAIKEAKQATAALHFRNALFEAQNQATRRWRIIVDTNGKILLYNKQFAEIWKMPQEILDNKDDAAAVQHSAGIVADPQRFVDSVQNLYSKKTETSREEILFKDGRVIERNGNPIVGENGTFYGWAWYFRDITERIRGAQKLAESESLFRSIVEQAPVAITLTRGEDVVIESINAPMLKIMGKPSRARCTTRSRAPAARWACSSAPTARPSRRASTCATRASSTSRSSRRWSRTPTSPTSSPRWRCSTRCWAESTGERRHLYRPDALSAGVRRYAHGSRVPGWDEAVDLDKDPAGIPDPATTPVPDELRERSSATSPATPTAARRRSPRWPPPSACTATARPRRSTRSPASCA